MEFDLPHSEVTDAEMVSNEAEELLRNYKLTPATLAFRLENRDVPPGGKLRWMPKPHLMYISLKIAQGIAKGNARIIISAPPRHGKSKLCTVHGPLWTLENFEDYPVAVVTYGADLSTDFARETRDYILKNDGLLDVKLREDASRLDNFYTTKGGILRSIGLQGPFIGRGAKVLFVDDYIKTIKEALSPTYRQDVYEWFTLVAMQRLEPDASVIIIATRWHHDDLIGRLLKEFPEDWEYIAIPAIAEQDDVLGRAVGEPLFPERYDIKALNSRKRYFGSMFFDAIYQQKPHDEAGRFAQREWIKVVKELPAGSYRFIRVWDLAGTQDGGDYTVGGLLAKNLDTNDVYLCNIVRGQWSAARVEAKVKLISDLDGQTVDVGIEEEGGSAGKIVSNHYTVNVLPNRKVIIFKAGNTHKLVKAQPFLAAAEAGKFYMLEAGWNKAFLDELEVFPNGGHDDQVDVCAHGYEALCGKRKLPGTWGRQIVRATAAEQQAILNGQKGDVMDAIAGHKKRVTRRATFGRFR